MPAGLLWRIDFMRPSSGFSFKRLLMALLLAGIAYVGISLWRLPDVGYLAKENPKTTALIEHRAEEAAEAGKKPRRKQTWVNPASLPEYVSQAVLVSEDASFYRHEGMDTKELKNAVRDAALSGKAARGASTITQQLAKNLYLSGERSLLRKLKEVVLAKRLEDALTKQRILALYLNVIELGDGVYGIEEGARAHFGKSARSLSVAEAAMLASMLPAPRKWLPAKKPRILQTRAERLVGRLQQYGRIDAAHAEEARDDLRAFFKGAAGDESDAEN